MFSGKENTKAEPGVTEAEGRYLAHLNKVSYDWLGQRFIWFNKIRTATKGGFELFQGKNLEQQMEATRSALNFVTKNTNGAFVLAFNTVIDSVKNSGVAPEGWPEKIEMEDRNNPPMIGPEQDAIILCFLPLQYLNVTKTIRDRGKGIDFYTDGLIKKVYFKLIGYYSNGAHWRSDWLGHMLAGLPEDAGMAEINAKLSRLKSDIESFVPTYLMFRFGRASAQTDDPANKNALDENFRLGDKELIPDLYFQSLLLTGMHNFFFKYYLVLLASTDNKRAISSLSQIFRPALARCEEMRLRFQSSFTMERDKIRLRAAYQTYYKDREKLPPVETITEKGKRTQKINYTHAFSDGSSYARGPQWPENQTKN